MKIHKIHKDWNGEYLKNWKIKKLHGAIHEPRMDVTIRQQKVVRALLDACDWVELITYLPTTSEPIVAKGVLTAAIHKRARPCVLEKFCSLGYGLNEQVYSSGWTPLHWAVSLQDVEAARTLLKYGHDPNFLDCVRNIMHCQIVGGLTIMVITQQV